MRFPRNARDRKRDDEIEHEDPDVGADELHAGRSEFEADRKECTEEAEDRAARAKGWDQRGLK